MAVPKKRTGHSAQGKRRSNWKAAKPTLTKCPNCGQAVLAHTVCTACGTYKNKPVRLKDQAAAAEVKEEKKTRKSTKKAKAEAPAKEVKETSAAEEVKETKVVKEAKEAEEKKDASEEKAE